MRILHAHSGNLYGGVETMLVTLAGTGSALEHRVALCFEGRLSEALAALGTPVASLGPVRFSRPWTVRRARRRLADVIVRDRPDALVVHSTWSHAAFGAVAARAGVPLVHWLHAPPGGPACLARWSQRQPPALVLCNSQYTCAGRGALFRDAASTMVHYAVSPPADSPTDADRTRIRRSLDTPDDAVVVIQVGRLEPWKGHRLLLEALGAVRSRRNWYCWIVGGAQRASERAYHQHLTRQAAALGLKDRIRFLGERRDVPSLLRAADVFCQPNVEPEPFGIAFVEALYAGLPVVATRMGGPLEIVDESCGVLVEPEVAAVRAALERLMDDGAHCAHLAAGGPGRARDLCDPARQSARLAEALRSVILNP